MQKRNSILTLLLLLILAIPGLYPNVSYASRVTGATQDDKKSDHKAKKEEKKQVLSDAGGKPVLWTEPADIASLDLFYGSGGPEGAPNASETFTFVRRSTSGTQKKIIVKDAEDREWTVKFGQEARPETTAARIVWAMGYHADQDYFVKLAHIQGWGGGDGTNVRFERRKDGFKEVGLWTWESNPFTGTRELQGLKVLMLLLNNWDLKYDNNKIVKPDKKSEADPDERIYYVADLGATFGKTGSIAHTLHIPGHPPAGSKDKPSQYQEQAFIDGVNGSTVKFHYKGKDHMTVQGISVEHARWMGNLLAKLTERQLKDAFRAGGYDDTEISILTKSFQSRVGELQNLK